MAKQKFKFDLKTIKTPIFTISFCDTLTGKAEPDPKSNGKKSFQMLFKSKADLKAMQKEIARVAGECFEAKQIKKNSFNKPIMVIDEDAKEEYEYLADYDNKANASTWKPIPIVDRMKKRLDALDADDLQKELYAGCECKAMVYVAPYDNESKGVALRVASLIKLADGEALAGGGAKSNTDSDFEDEFDEEPEDDDVEDDDADDAEEKPKKKSKSKAPKKSDVEDAFDELSRKEKRSVLKEFGIDDLDELEVSDFEEFIEVCEAG